MMTTLTHTGDNDMGTRADFYVGTGADAAWVASIAWDGYPEGIDDAVLGAETESDFIRALTDFLSKRDDVSHPGTGWPWPWDSSHTTDYAYQFNGDAVEVFSFGQPHGVGVASRDDDTYDDDAQKAVFPDMTDRQNVALEGKRSGLLVFTS